MSTEPGAEPELAVGESEHRYRAAFEHTFHFMALLAAFAMLLARYTGTEDIVIGAPSKHVAMKLLELYATLGRPMLITDVHSAEMIKYASNAFLAVKISFINELAKIADVYDVDITDVVLGIGMDPRIGHHFLQAGLGYGGSCLPKDLSSLEHQSIKNKVKEFEKQDDNQSN
jgi:nucleotide sugar dehydrogenase